MIDRVTKPDAKGELEQGDTAVDTEEGVVVLEIVANRLKVVSEDFAKGRKCIYLTNLFLHFVLLANDREVDIIFPGGRLNVGWQPPGIESRIEPGDPINDLPAFVKIAVAPLDEASKIFAEKGSTSASKSSKRLSSHFCSGSMKCTYFLTSKGIRTNSSGKSGSRSS